jgi:hypothetical protein
VADASTTGDQYSQAVVQLRTSATWLVATAGVVGGLIIAGLQLKSIGGLHDGRLVGAVAAAIIGVTAVGVAIWEISQVLMPIASSPKAIESGPDFQPLRDAIADDPDILQGEGGDHPDLAGLHASFNEASSNARDSYQRVLEEPANDERQTAYKVASARLDQVRTVLNDVEGYGTFLAVAARFSRARLVMLIAGVVLVSMGALFAYCANPPKSINAPTTPSAAISPATIVRVRLTQSGLQELRPELGHRCKRNSLRAIVIGGTAEAPEVAMLPRRHCRALKLALISRMRTTAASS